MKKILVTGASGFIGAYVRKALSVQGYEFVSLMHLSRKIFQTYEKEKIITGNLAETEILYNKLIPYSIDTCIHLAWEGIPDYSFEMSQKNLFYGLQLLRLCKKLHISHLLISGSCWEYQNPHGRITEEWPLDNSNHFKAAKNSLQFISHAFCSEHGIRFHWLRLFYVYGSGQKDSSLIPYIVNEFSHGRMPYLSGALNRNDFVHASDVAAAFIRTMELNPQETILNIGTGVTIQVSEIVELTAALLGKTHLLSADKLMQSGPASDFCADMERTERALGWTPELSIGKEWTKEMFFRYIL